MSVYDDTVAYLDAEVHPRCDYDIYSYMRDVVDEMEAENAKLRKRLAQYELFECVVGDPSTEFAHLRRELHRMQRENAKLRSLVHDAYLNLLNRESCMQLTPSIEQMRATDEIRARMRELGIEVDE